MDPQPLSATAPSPLPPAGPGNRATAPATLADDASGNLSAAPSTDTPEPETDTPDPSTGDPSTGTPDADGFPAPGYVRITFLYNGFYDANVLQVFPYYIAQIAGVTVRSFQDDQPEVSWFRRLPPGVGQSAAEFVPGWRTTSSWNDQIVSFDIDLGNAATELWTAEQGLPSVIPFRFGFSKVAGGQIYAPTVEPVMVLIRRSNGTTVASSISIQPLWIGPQDPVQYWDLASFWTLGNGDWIAANITAERMFNPDTQILVPLDENIEPSFAPLP